MIADSLVSARTARPGGGKKKAETKPEAPADFDDQIHRFER
ncbi:MAG: hypothetical protein U5K43_15500 [Halofilum sp. (in: g-proteobacteria)]|nr:hypothetical protein [Halofilum sp. (in: g-proteobacteria)]